MPQGPSMQELEAVEVQAQPGREEAGQREHRANAAAHARRYSGKLDAV